METKHLIQLKRKVEIKAEVYTAYADIKPDGYCCISFHNQGETNAVILGNLTIEPGESHHFNFEADEYVTTNIPLIFDGEGKNKLTVIKTYKS
ncbi:MAG: hypothetical protein IKP81_08660 [Paludibacteraceae bacterium]|nr:hypothetical protein [Paludibacteraceae bacterium]MCR5569865.1 hypothetical protein [Paludibacteraceae bacterium]